MNKSEGFSFNPELAEDHRRYLESLFDYHEKRLQSIESKVLSIIGQSGLIISLLSVSLSLLKEPNEMGTLIMVILVGIFAAALVFFVKSIFEATQVLNIGKYQYQSGSVNTVKKNHKNRDEFREEEIRDLINSIENNHTLTSQKGDHLIVARRYFVIALFITALFGVLMAITLLIPLRIECGSMCHC
jgi:hypothetical protein